MHRLAQACDPLVANLDAAFGRSEPDEEIQDLLKASVGLNLGLHYLSGSITYDPAVMAVDPLLASQIVWLDCLLTNVDRTARNTNMLIWNKELWLIDHGAALYFHHSWDGFAQTRSSESNAPGKIVDNGPSASLQEQAGRPFALVKDHVLLPWASQLEAVDAVFRSVLTAGRIRDIVGLIPDKWLVQAAEGLGGKYNTAGSGEASDESDTPPAGLAAQRREVYLQFLTTRVAASAIFVNEAQHAREALI